MDIKDIEKRNVFVEIFKKSVITVYKFINYKLQEMEQSDFPDLTRSIDDILAQSDRVLDLIKTGLRSNPDIILEIMYTQYLAPYEKYIYNKNDKFFLQHNYRFDIPDKYEGQQELILGFVDSLKIIWNKCNEQEKKIIWSNVTKILNNSLYYLLCKKKYDKDYKNITSFNKYLRLLLFDLYRCEIPVIHNEMSEYFLNSYINGRMYIEELSHFLIDNYEYIKESSNGDKSFSQFLSVEPTSQFIAKFMYYLNEQKNRYSSLDWYYLKKMVRESAKFIDK